MELDLTERVLIAEERKKLRSKTFGIPELRKYPLNDREHVLSAIRFFNRVDDEHEEELAENILKAMDVYKIPTTIIGDKNRLQRYISTNK